MQNSDLLRKYKFDRRKLGFVYSFIHRRVITIPTDVHMKYNESWSEKDFLAKTKPSYCVRDSEFSFASSLNNLIDILSQFPMR